MTSSEKFSLKWNDFQENVSSSFRHLRHDSKLTDVTLISEDGEHLDSHKLILSASSPFFMNIFQRNKHPQPLIYLKGFPGRYLNSILDFMYHGKADIYQEDLDAFLALAEELQLKGLTGGGEEQQQKEIHVTPKEMDKKQQQVQELYKQPLKSKLNKIYEIPKAETYVASKTTTVMTTEHFEKVFYNGGTPEGLKETLQSMISKDGTVLTCTVCGKSKDKAGNQYANRQMERHVESMHVDGVVYECNNCEKTFRSKNALYSHRQLACRTSK